MTATPTAATPTPTPEELAARVGWPHESGMRLCGEKDIAAAIRQHSEAQRPEIERLTAALAAMEREALDWREVATSNAKERDASQERERGMREALTVAANRLARCAIDHPAGSREMSERSEWAEEARSAALAKETADER